MSSTYSQKMSKIIAKELGVLYQKTYASFQKALEQVHPSLSQEEPEEETSGQIPEHARDWVETIAHMNRQCEKLKKLHFSTQPSSENLEKIVMTMDLLYQLAKNLEDAIDRSSEKASDEYMDAVVRQAALGQFHGWGAWMPPDFEDLWLSFVRTGYADEVHVDETDYHEISDSCGKPWTNSCRMSWILNKAGLDTFFINDEEPNAAFLELEKTIDWPTIDVDY